MTAREDRLEPKMEALLTEHLQHAMHLLEGQIRTLEARLAHQQAMNHQRLLLLEENLFGVRTF